MKPGGEPGSSGTRRAAPVRQDLILPVLTQRNCKSLRRYKANPAAAFGPLTASPLSAHRPYRGTKRATRRSRQSKEQARATPYKARSRRPGPAPAPPPSFGPAFSRSRGWAALLPQRTSLRPLPSDDLSTKASGAPVKPGSHTRVTITEGLRWRSWRAPPSRASPPPTLSTASPRARADASRERARPAPGPAPRSRACPRVGGPAASSPPLLNTVASRV